MKRSIRLLFILGVIVSALTISVFATDIVNSGTCGENLTWTLDDAGVLTISGTGDMYDYSWGANTDPTTIYPPWFYGDKTKIKTVIVQENVTSIGSDAFYGCKNLSKVQLPSTLRKIGDSAFYDCKYINSVYTPSLESWLSISFGNSTSSNPMCYARYLYIAGDDTVTDIVVPKSISTIHTYAFLNWKITSLTLHEGVTTIESGAFYNSGTNIKTAGPIGSGCDYEFSWTEELPDYAFQYMSGLTGVTIPDTVERIGNSAFYDCALSEITIPDNVTSIGYSAFRSCDNLTTVTLSDNMTSIGSGAFDYCSNLETVYAGPLEKWLRISFEYASNPMHYADTLYLDGEQPVHVVIPDGISAIGDYAFLNCGSLRSVTMGDSVVAIGDSAFLSCGNLSSVTMGSGLSEIGSSAFSGCASLKAVSIGSNVSKIDSYAFYNCLQLESIDIPDSVVSIGEYAFGCCESLSSIRLGSGIRKIDTNAFHNCTALSDIYAADLTDWLDIEFADPTANPAYHGGNVYLNNQLLTSAVIPDTETEIREYAFYKVKSLTDVVIPDSINTIATHAFFGCSNLTSVSVPGSVQRIGDCAFSNCSSLQTAVIGSGVTSIGVRAFSACDQLSEISIASTVTAIGEYALLDCTSLTSVMIPNSVSELGQYAFSGCTSLKSVTLSENLTTMPAGLFSRCTSLKSITIPASVTHFEGGLSTSVSKVFFEGDLPEISASAFSGVTAYCYYPAENDTYTSVVHEDFGGTLVWVPIGDSATGNSKYCGENITWSLSADGTLTISGVGDMYDYSAADSVFAPWYDHLLDINSVVITDGVERIGESAFHSCTALASVSIPDSVTAIGDNAFYKCSALTGITLPDNLISVGDEAFYYCSALTGVTLPDKLISVGDSAFYYCSALTAVTLPDSLISIGDMAFSNTAISSITIPDQVASIGVEAFNGCKKLYRAVIGASVTDIPNGMFSGCYKLSSVVFPDGLKTIGDNAFSNCYELDTFTLPEGLTHIGARCFAMCGFDSFTSGFSTIVLPSTLEYVGDLAFWYCSDLYSIKFSGGKFTLGSQIFRQNQKKLTIVFQCVAPTFSDDTFGEMVYGVTAYYPSNEKSWTVDVLQNYGGKVTWINEDMEVTIPEDGTPGDGSGGGDNEGGEGSGDGGSDGGSEGGGESGSSGCTDHSYTTTVVKPTCTESGYTTYTCTKCNNFYTSDYTAPLGHAEVVNAAVAATCTESGLTEGKCCSVCNEVLLAQEVIPALGHDYVEGVCARCGDKDPSHLHIINQPDSYVGSVNDDVTFTVEASGNGLTYAWFYSDDGGASWKVSHSPGYLTNSLQPILRAYRDGYLFYCRITDVFGNSVDSDVVSMVVKSSEITITEQPADVESGIVNQLYTFKVTATGDNLTYRWEYSEDGGNTWLLSWNQGYNADTLKVRLYAYRSGYLYRCVVTSGLKTVLVSEPAELILQDPSVEITAQSGNVSTVNGKTITFHVDATGNDLTYAWYRSNDKGATWTTTFLTGYNTDTLTFVANSNRAAMYMCKITDGSGKAVWSEPVKLTLLSAELKILTQPTDVTCANGATASFTVEAQGDALRYLWYASSDGGETWTTTYLSGYNTSTLSFTVNASRAAKLYKCVITDAGGNTVETNVVKVIDPANITQ